LQETKENIMQGKIIFAVVAIALSSVVAAQDSTQTAQSTNNQTRSEVDNQSNSTRNNQQSSDDQNVPTKGGSMNNSMRASNGQKGDFDALDKSHRGYLMPSDVSNNKKLSMNFKACDKDHDGRLSREEYNSCSGGM